MALRKRNIQELVDEHAERMNQKPTPPVLAVEGGQLVPVHDPVLKSLKRTR
jgi:hypothetical protein